MALPQRKLHRLKSWNYSENGYYFVTICTKDKRKLLSRIYPAGIDTRIELTKIGRTVLKSWTKTAEVYPNIKIDFFCIMPNHIHGIVVIDAPTGQNGPALDKIIRAFKSVTTRQYNKTVPQHEKNQLWQSSYYDEIIRNEEMLNDVRKYIAGNPSKWLEDALYVP